MADYMASLRMLAERSDEVYYPTHGGRIKNPQRYVRGIMVHRKQRETQILDCLDQGVTNIPAMVERMYQDLDPRLTGAARHSVFSHIIDLAERGIIKSEGEISLQAEYRKVE
ncbi:MAG: hypothetical protein HN731_00420 [Rhodospirillaceae bacterium]|nr:hypothetical protein [Rhodospirillaceae bacterium]